jgi:peptide-methionine (S)-S-oxide reductase
MPGYSGGTTEDPTYEQVSQGDTGHAEAIEVVFDPTIIDYETLLKVFFATHDPTTLNRQGNDVGTQYRSAIFFHSPHQEEIAKSVIKRLTDTKRYPAPIVTEVSPFARFYPAEQYHRNFYENGNRPDYCRVVIDPKIRLLVNQFPEKIQKLS